MDKFAENAFNEAMENQTRKEFDAYRKFSENEFMFAQRAIAERIGMDKMDALCGAAIKSGVVDTLAEYAQSLMMFGFHKGYKARMEEE